MVSRALDIGCAVGRSTFELATCFDEVLGIDFSEAFIRRANDLKLNGKEMYEMVVEGELTVDMEAVIHPDIVSMSEREIEHLSQCILFFFL